MTFRHSIEHLRMGYTGVIWNKDRNRVWNRTASNPTSYYMVFLQTRQVDKQQMWRWVMVQRTNWVYWLTDEGHNIVIITQQNVHPMPCYATTVACLNPSTFCNLSVSTRPHKGYIMIIIQEETSISKYPNNPAIFSQRQMMENAANVYVSMKSTVDDIGLVLNV